MNFTESAEGSASDNILRNLSSNASPPPVTLPGGMGPYLKQKVQCSKGMMILKIKNSTNCQLVPISVNLLSQQIASNLKRAFILASYDVEPWHGKCN